MTKAQWSAVYDYCAEYGYDQPRDLLDDLKSNGTIDNGTKLNQLHDGRILSIVAIKYFVAELKKKYEESEDEK